MSVSPNLMPRKIVADVVVQELFNPEFDGSAEAGPEFFVERVRVVGVPRPSVLEERAERRFERLVAEREAERGERRSITREGGYRAARAKAGLR